MVASARSFFAAQPPPGEPPFNSGRAAANRLSQLLLEPIRTEVMTATALVISADESLTMLPIDALTFSGSPLVVTKNVTMIQSGSLLVLARDELNVERHFDFDLLAIGGPQYETDLIEVSESVTTGLPPTKDTGTSEVVVLEQQVDDSSLLKRLAKLFKSATDRLKLFFLIHKKEPTEFDTARYLRGNSGDGKAVARAFAELKNRWPDLPGARQETTDVAALFPENQRTVIHGRDASEARLQRLNASGQLAKYRYLLFSTHGYLSMFEPALSSVVLSQTDTTDDADGYVTASEWAGYRLNSELIVLSACDTAVGDIVHGEGVTGLPYAMSVAGNRRSILTLWPVADEGTREFMVALFKRIHAGHEIKTALAETKREFVQHKVFSAPNYWAPFVLYGG